WGRAGGDGGTSSVAARAGTLQLQGSLLGNATAGNTGGAFQADADSLANFSALIANTAAGGFTGAQSYRARSGDITVGAADTIKSNLVTLVADGGGITMNGTIDASGAAGGGRVELDAASKLWLTHATQIPPHATPP